MTDTGLEGKAKQQAIKIWRELWGPLSDITTQSASAELEIIGRHLASFAQETANVTAESMRETCIKTIKEALKGAAIPSNVLRLIEKIKGLPPDPAWLQRHDAAVRLEEHKLTCTSGCRSEVLKSQCLRRREIFGIAALTQAEEESNP